MNDSPFPLKRRFWMHIVPGMGVLLVLMVAATVYVTTDITETIYLSLAHKRADAIATGVAHTEPQAWAHLLAHGDTAADQDRLRAAIQQEAKELRIQALKVYDLAGRVLYSPDKVDYAAREVNPALRAAVLDGAASLKKVVENGQQLYEMYVPYQDDKGQLVAVFELYEPVQVLDSLLWRSALIAALVPGSGVILLLVALTLLVGRAQANIDTRARDLVATSRKLESFLSASAADAARGGGDIPSKRVRLTLFYSDARDFTGYSESNPPERVVWFLNELMGIQVAAVQAHGGDVDKMIGDALLARFDGPDAEARALAAARDVQSELARANLPRPVGIGVYTGEVISGAIGAAHRRDFTVIGDGVNVSARLCSAAGAGEIVTDADTLTAAGPDAADGFGAEEPITVKGRREAVRIHRFIASTGT